MAIEVGFYHLTRTTLPDALAKLLGRVLAVPKRALVLCGTPERLAALDEALWASTDPDWLPHGTPATGHANLQPIWLTTTPPDAAGAPNAATMLFLVDGIAPTTLDPFERVLDLFDGGNAAAVAAARQRWSAAREAGHQRAYWKQGARGWEKAGD